MEFLGHKGALLSQILEQVTAHVRPGSVVADAFCGTGSVSVALRTAGYRVHANDLLPLCTTWARAGLAIPANLTFAGVLGGSRASNPPMPGGRTRLSELVDHLNALPPVDGWVTQNYTPASIDLAGVERRYLTVANGRRVDAVRSQLREWRPLLTDDESAVLMSALIAAVVGVSNIAGTYGCYLKAWKPRSLEDLHLETPVLVSGGAGGHRVTCVDAEQAVAQTDADLVYADPPYTKRQYAAYYHLLNSLALDEEPHLVGSTGLPPWRRWQSDWCYRQSAVDALDRLAGKTNAGVLILSYSSDGHIQHGDVLEVLRRYGEVSCSEVERRRYRSSRLEHRSPTVLERLYVMSR